MENSEFDELQDRPIKDASEDLLSRDSFVDSLIRSLLHVEYDERGNVISRQSTGYVVGLTGVWGLGKSSVLSLVEKQLLASGDVVVVMFNPWLFTGREELLHGYFNSLREALSNKAGKKFQEIQRSVDRYRAAIETAGDAAALAVDIGGAGGVASGSRRFLKRLFPGNKNRLSALVERRDLEKKLLDLKKAVVVLIDELDRIEDDEVRAVAQLVKAVGDIRGISYLVAYDPERVTDALGRGEGLERTQSGERYLEKVIQYPIPLRPLFMDDVDILLKRAVELRGLSFEEPANDEQEKILGIIKRGIESPREIKRLIGAFSIHEAITRGEVCPYDVLAYCWMVSKSPTLYAELVKNFDRVVDDPTKEELSARLVERLERTPASSIREILGDGASDYEVLLKVLFPSLGDRDLYNEKHDGTRISRRRNLVRLLYHGDPPSMVSRKELTRIWSVSSEAKARDELRKLRETGLLTDFLDRSDDFIHEMPASGDSRVFRAISRLTIREHDWVTGAENASSIADDAATIALHLAKRRPILADRAKNIVEKLIASDDLVVVPKILRKHLFHFGITKHSSQERSDSLIFDLAETKEMRDREIPRYKKAILDGFYLRRIPTMDAAYAISNADMWDDELRESLTRQLMRETAISTFAALVVPPGYLIERSSLNELVDADQVQKFLVELGRVEDWIEDAWMRSAVVRFKAVLDRKNPMFAGEDE